MESEKERKRKEERERERVKVDVRMNGFNSEYTIMTFGLNAIHTIE